MVTVVRKEITLKHRVPQQTFRFKERVPSASFEGWGKGLRNWGFKGEQKKNTERSQRERGGV